ncbi:bifunctional phosphoribosylaminoimidazole carboxylase/phosphoribosylaminoimidazole succinocarboxamide synthetase isoform X7 [Pseudophryne corroboree]|uniref:bifunctional phosphoribosylaminoimidazole carboxylase/phosphoribosylaminoimidazole succinocarboxamide synthetase isoform X7 n=1 Tax=Pseudophryne corroboree TaxID=495146 RepID=UPI0030812E28
MERGAAAAGRYWTEDEIRALISVWSERSIRKQLQGTLRNKGLFMYIARRMQQLGVYRDWKQCRAKYKNLKYEYRAMHCGHSTGDMNKLRFYGELHAILGSSEAAAGDEASNAEPGASYVDPSGDVTAMEEAMLGHQKHGGTTNPLLIPPVCNEGGKHWTTRETRALINIWSDKNIRGQLKGTVRNQRIFEHIARLLQQSGIDRDWRQCRTKYKNLKHEYVVVKKAHESGNKSKTMKYFNELETILSSKPAGHRKTHTDKPSHLSCTRAAPSEVPADCPAGDRSMRLHSAAEKPQLVRRWVALPECCTTVLAKSPVSNEEARTLSEGNLSKVPDENISSPKTPNIKQEPIFSDHPSDSEGAEQPLSSRENVTMTVVKEETSQVGTELEDEADKDFRIVTVNDTGGGRNWSDHEVRSLLHVWSEERISRQLEGTFRNKELFEEIAHKLLECGINRDWKQCRTKYKNLKYEYYSVKKDETLHALRKSMKFYEEIDHLIQRLPKASEVTADSVHIEGFTCRGICEEPNTITTQQGLIAEERTVEMNKLVIGLKRKSSPNEPNTPDKKKPTRIPIPEASIINMSESYATGRLSSPHSGSQSASKEQAPGEARFHDQGDSCVSIMESSAELRVGKKLNEGKTKEVYELPEHPGCVLMQSKDQITAGNAARKDHMEGKASISNKTTSCIFKMLQEAGIKTAFVKKCSETGFIATHCEMIPIEWVCRRIATGSFLKRNPGVKEGYRFYPPKVETFFKDDANNDPQWSEEQLIATKLTCAGLLIGQAEVDIMSHSTVAIFEILEKAWSTQDCTLVDMKIEFGVDVTKKEIVLADVIDNDSWRLWPSGDKTQQKDKQTYRDLKEITPEAMQMVKRNFEWVADRVELLLTSESQGRVVVLMGSISDLVHCEKIKKSSSNYGIPCELRVTSAHKGPDETLRIKSEYEGDGIPTVFVAVAGRSNGLGPVLSGNTAYPVINCPPLTADWGAQDVWSSLRMPSGLGCSTVLSPEAAAQFAAQIFGLNNHLVWSKLRSCTLNTWISLKQADVKLRECSM